MRMLLVEDNVAFAESLTPRLRKVGEASLVTHAVSLEGAKRALVTDYFDLIILDLKIPVNDGELAIAKEHGEAAFHHIRITYPGTPMFILTGSEADDFEKRLVRYGESHDIWGSGNPLPMYEFFGKEDVEELLQSVKSVADEVKATNGIRIDTRGRDLDLSLCHARILKVFTRGAGGKACEVRPLSGGLSEARVVRAAAKDSQQKTIAVCAAKLAPREHVSGEHQAFHDHVKRLRFGSYPPVFRMIDKGVGGESGLFYALAEEQKDTVFDIIANDPAKAASLVAKIANGVGRWTDARQILPTKVSEIRASSFGSRVDFEEIIAKYDLHFVRDIEEMTLDVAKSHVHGDLHCGNILVGSAGEPVMIDFGDVRFGYTCCDAVALELSLLFHPSGAVLEGSAALRDRVEEWPDVERYADSSRLAPFIVNVREWAYDIGGGDQDLLANGYAYVCRQFKYPTIDPAITRRLLLTICSQLKKE